MWRLPFSRESTLPKEPKAVAIQPADPEGFDKALDAAQRAQLDGEAAEAAAALPPPESPPPVSPAYRRNVTRLADFGLRLLAVGVGQFSPRVGLALIDGVEPAMELAADNLLDYAAGRWGKSIGLAALLVTFTKGALDAAIADLQKIEEKAQAADKAPAPVETNPRPNLVASA